jgi:hypothetical protein
MTFLPSSKSRLTHHDLGRFSGETLFDRIARAVCRAGCLPRKELYEAWEVGRRTRRLFRGGRVVDVAGGHGLLAHVMLLLDDSSSHAIVVDPSTPDSAGALQAALAGVWPRLTGRVAFTGSGLADVELEPGDVVVSSHACGGGRRAHRRAPVLPRSRDVRRRTVPGMGRCSARGRHDARRPTRPVRLQGVDAGHPGGDHTEAPAAPGRAACERHHGARFFSIGDQSNATTSSV